VIELLPRAAPAEHAQPVGAQQLSRIGVAVRGKESVHILCCGIVEHEFQAPVVEPGLEHMPFQFFCIPGKLDHVARAIGVIGGEDRCIG
jgi:hypothetical protein